MSFSQFRVGWLGEWDKLFCRKLLFGELELDGGAVVQYTPLVGRLCRRRILTKEKKTGGSVFTYSSRGTMKKKVPPPLPAHAIGENGVLKHQMTYRDKWLFTSVMFVSVD